jgi:predicted metal-dependent peptidase
MPLAQHELDASPVAGEIELWPQLTLSAAHAKQWSEFKACMLWAVPSFSDIWLAMMVDKNCDHAWFTDRIPTAATDDKYLYINPDWFFKLSLDEQLFVACHEVEHAMFGHAGMGYSLGKAGEIRYNDGVVLPYHSDLMNVAMDYVINAQLVEAKVGSMPEGGCLWLKAINGDMGVLDAYRICYKQQKGGGGGGKGKGGGSGDGNSTGNLPGSPFDKLLRPGQGRGKSANKAMAERSQSEWDTTVTAAMEAAKLRGQLPSNLDRAFNKRLQPKADWRDLYMLAVSRKIGNDRYTWDILNQQLAYRRIGAPGRTSYGCDLVVIAVDTSGSINQRTLDVFLAETTALLEQAKPKRVLFVQCDAKIHEWENIEGTDDLFGRKLKGGGGSCTEPVFERIEEENVTPDMLVYLTDLYVSFPDHAPSYPVVWGVVDNASAEPPFGELVHVPAQHELV